MEFTFEKWLEIVKDYIDRASEEIDDYNITNFINDFAVFEQLENQEIKNLDTNILQALHDFIVESDNFRESYELEELEFFIKDFNENRFILEEEETISGDACTIVIYIPLFKKYIQFGTYYSSYDDCQWYNYDVCVVYPVIEVNTVFRRQKLVNIEQNIVDHAKTLLTLIKPC